MEISIIYVGLVFVTLVLSFETMLFLGKNKPSLYKLIVGICIAAAMIMAAHLGYYSLTGQFWLGNVAYITLLVPLIALIIVTILPLKTAYRRICAYLLVALYSFYAFQIVLQIISTIQKIFCISQCNML